MCGIAGLILDAPDHRAPGWLAEMTQRLHHRGPDDGGAVVFATGGRPYVDKTLRSPSAPVDWGYFNAAAGLGARRLAIIDLTPTGHQPMSADDGRIWIAHNGEIYNHADLRSELIAHGVEFSGSSDTEVALAAYRAWGPACFARFEGMWSIAIFDWIAGRLVLSRDRFGIKPLHIARFDGGFAFASEIKSLFAIPDIQPNINEARLADFLTRGLVDHTDETLFEGIWSLPAGTWLEFHLRGRDAIRHSGAIHRYWMPNFNWANRPTAHIAVRDALNASVVSHLRSDVAIGSCLSGGIDSSTIVAMIHEAAAHAQLPDSHLSQHTFTAALPGDALDESTHARTVLAKFPELRGDFVTPTGEGLLRDLDALLWHQEQPFGSPSIYMQWEVMRQARQSGITVLLDGQGGDELFCGYPGAWPPYIAYLLTHGRWVRAIHESRHVTKSDFSPGQLAAHTVAAMLPEIARDALRKRSNARQMPWLVPDLFNADPKADFEESLQIVPSPTVSGTWRDGALSKWLWRGVLGDSLPSLLRFEDRNSMAFSVEARVPFLDRRVVELAMSIPPRQKLRDGLTKAVLRDTARGLVPDAILARRDKIGFAAPTRAWLAGPLQPWWRDLIASQSFRERGCFAPKGIQTLVSQVESCDARAADALWRVALTEAWARKWLDHRT